MGEVYRARDERLGRDVALKILPADFAADDDRRARFLREARLAAGITHPNVAMIHEADESDGQLFYAMELVRGETLQARVRPGGLALDDLLDLVIPLTEGLAAAHRHGVVHRDLKPQNVMVDQQGYLKILDFGLSRLASEDPDSSLNLTRTEQIVGTPLYMSPEQVRGGAVDTRSDLFSLGTILYELGCGVRPFFGTTHGEIMDSVLNQEPAPMARANPRVDDGLQRVVSRLLEKDVERRTQTADDVLAALRRLRRDRSSPRTSRRNLIAGILVVVAAAIAAPFLIPGDESGAGRLKKLVVLPFVKRGPATEDYFADGFTEAIAARLAGLRQLGVVSQRSAERYRGTDMTTEEIADELGVDYLLEGTVQRESNSATGRVRVVSRLVRAADDTQVWARTFDEEMAEVFRVQTQIAEEVAREIDLKLLEPERRALGKKPTANLEAYDSFLQAQDYYRRGTSSLRNMLGAIRLLERVVELDSQFAVAYAWLSRCHMHLFWFRLDRTEERHTASRAAADRAMQLDPEHPAVRVAMAQHFYHGYLDYEKALEHLAVARRAAPNDIETLLMMSYIYRRQGKVELAASIQEACEDIDSRYPEIPTNLGSTYLLMREFDKATAAFDRAIRVNPESATHHYHKCKVALLGMGRPDQARAALAAGETELTDWRTDVKFRLMRCRLPLWTGSAPEALRHLAKLESEAFPAQYEFVPVGAVRAVAHELEGRAEDARVAWEEARKVAAAQVGKDPQEAMFHGALGIALAGLGRRDEAIRAGERAVELLPVAKEAWSGSLRAAELARIYAMVGEHEKAIDMLEHLLSIPSEISKLALPIDPRWTPLRQHPRFVALCR